MAPDVNTAAPPGWLVSIFRVAFPELAAMTDDELAARIAAVERAWDDTSYLLHEEAMTRSRAQVGGDDVDYLFGSDEAAS